MLEKTVDNNIYISERGENYIVYWDVYGGEKWRTNGKCNYCGDCWQGAVDSVPDADCPVRPEISEMPNCVLTGEYL